MSGAEEPTLASLGALAAESSETTPTFEVVDTLSDDEPQFREDSKSLPRSNSTPNLGDRFNKRATSVPSLSVKINSTSASAQNSPYAKKKKEKGTLSSVRARFKSTLRAIDRMSSPKLKSKSDRKKKGKTQSAVDPHEFHHVLDVTKIANVTYDPKTKRYQGMPKEWESELSKQFGLPPFLLECAHVEGYTAPIPGCLIMMKDYLVKNGGLDVQGIFRLAPDKKASNDAKQSIDEGRFSGVDDVNCISNLLKVWFRDLPRALLQSAKTEEVLNCRTEEQVVSIIDSIEDPYNSILLWLLDLCADVAEQKDVNLMSSRNMAIVMTPNLYKAPELDATMSNATQVMQLCKKYTEFFEQAVDWRSNNRDSSMSLKTCMELERVKSCPI